MPFDWMARELEHKQQQGYLRSRTVVEYEKDSVICIAGKHYLNFSSNDYLAMRQHEGLLQCWVEGLAQFGAGSGASPLVTGYTKAHQALESYLAEHLKREAVLLFNSGFSANQALCQALFPAGGNIVADKYMHASFIDGAQGSSGQLRRFKHNDISHLRQQLAACDTADTLIACEGIYSMDGDASPLTELASLSHQHDCWMMVDDAHGLGVLGETGLGSVQAYGLSQQQVPIVMGTFGKAIGTGGAFVAGSQLLIDYLVNNARHYIYSTAMPSAQALATLYSFEHIATADKRDTLQQNIAYFKKYAAQCGIALMPSTSPIQPVVIGNPQRAVAFSEALKQRGIWAPAIRYPSVPKGTDRIRITLNSGHTRQDITAVCDALSLAAQETSHV